jgi:CRP-like cAMP-binding protein
MFLKYLLARNLRAQANVIDHLFNSSEKRLARTLLLMAGLGQPGDPKKTIPLISQETLAEMIGTTRSRVSCFMNKFRKLGYIEYKQGIRVNESLRGALLEDALPTDHSATPRLLDSQRSTEHAARQAKVA